ncbi:protein artichoke-like isoform X3 [Uranotaenia lowii]|nr:protein artichoke-like isoform X3 [Uranotaenia lowii]
MSTEAEIRKIYSIIFLTVSICVGLARSSEILPRENVRKLNFLDATVNERSYPNIWMLDMSNSITFTLPKGNPFFAHQTLWFYRCNNCSIRDIYRESFSRLPRLRVLHLDNNGLQFIHQDAFVNNQNLEKISLRNNRLVEFNTFRTINRLFLLRALDLSENFEFDFNNVDLKAEHLKRLQCDHCNVTKLDKRSLIGMPWISTLTLQYNSLEYVAENTFEHLERIENIDLSHNPELKRLHLKSTTLRIVEAENCSLEGILDTNELPALQYLNVRHNRISALNVHGFQQNRYIKSILLDGNEMKKFPEKLLHFNLAHLSTLCLDRNPIQPWASANEAKRLYIARNYRRNCLDDHEPIRQFELYLPEKNGEAVYRKETRYENCSENSCNFLSSNVIYIEPNYFTEMKNITEVNLINSHNFDLPYHKVFIRSQFVQRLSLVNCSITSIYDSSFEKLPNLQYLNLSENKLHSFGVPQIFRSNTKIEYIDLSNNEFKSLPFDVFRHLKSLRVLNFDFNPQLHPLHHNSLFLESESLQHLSCRFLA